MRFNIAAAALLGMVTSAFADDVTKKFDSIFSPKEDEVVKVGSTIEIAWSIGDDKYNDVKVDISVIGGRDQGHLVPLGNIASMSHLSFRF